MKNLFTPFYVQTWEPEKCRRNLLQSKCPRKKERELIKEWVNMAAQKNKEENMQAWKVKRYPKKLLRLLKITKRT